MNVFIACECSQIVTKAFRDRGHNAFSCDLKPGEINPDWHFQGDVLEVLKKFPKYHFDLLIGHPPCKYLAYSGAGFWDKPGRLQERLKALQFFAALWEAPVKRICLENPKSCASPVIAKYTQEVRPYFFGDREMKLYWLWLKNLPKLVHVKQKTLFDQATHTEKPQPLKYDKTTNQPRYYTDVKRLGKDRERFWPGIANAMAQQWGVLEN